ncbi:hypothetical protein SADUNF_Sadunf07G0103800 [Salix dunnii]|uniref:Uncharacterized protein n=1 Tax=Salix dunnii TaxID=1413687 RepID=A0A835JZZ8_9ROSI|nr:hypothetical protein SADUNF_Sadunf07G0103800 [Salix dunnii]
MALIFMCFRILDRAKDRQLIPFQLAKYTEEETGNFCDEYKLGQGGFDPVYQLASLLRQV